LDEPPKKLITLTNINFPKEHHIASIQAGPWVGGTYISFFPKGLVIRGSAILIKEVVMYDQIDFKKFKPANTSENDAVLYFVDEDGFHSSRAITSLSGFGKLQHQLGVLSAIAYLDQRDY